MSESAAQRRATQIREVGGEAIVYMATLGAWEAQA